LPENKTWFDKYEYDIPVGHLNGKFLFQHRIEPDELKSLLEKFEKEKL